jgi:FG-GAP repeat protein
LAASMAGQVTRVDKDGSTTGAQYDVVGCTNASTGSARLLAGVEGAAATELAQGTVELDAGGVCNGSGFTHIVRFSDVTLPGSEEATDGALVHPTELTFEVTDASNSTGSAKIQIWVDSKLPTLTPTEPIPLCGAVYQSATAITKNISFGTTALPVTLQVTSQGGTSQTYTETTFFLPDRVRFADIPLPLGINDLIVSSTEPSGNHATIPTAGSSCTVTVGNPPTVSWQQPIASSKLCASTTTTTNGIPDSDPVAPGWQGTLEVCTNIDVAANPAATVQFSSSVSGDVGVPVALDASGCATLDNVDLSESKAIVLVARTSPVDGLDGSASITVPVDVVPPTTIASVAASLLDRRETSFALGWTAPADNLGVTTYQVRSSRSPITSDAEFQAATLVNYTGVPSSAGSQDGVNATGLLIENDYYFAALPVDSAGNRAVFTATQVAARAQFNETILTPVEPGVSYGVTVDGTTSIDGDAYADLIVGTNRGRSAYIYFGSPSGYSTLPDVIIEGQLGGCGRYLAAIGDVDADGLQDVAITCPDQTVHILRGRTPWPSMLTLPDDTDYLIRTDAAADPNYANSTFGMHPTRLGDFNNDGIADFAVGAAGYDSGRGQVVVVYGSPAGQWPGETVIPGTSTNNTTILGEGPGGYFGFYLAALSNYYSTGGSTLVVTAQGVNAFTGRVHTFGGPLPGMTANASEANHTADGPVPGGFFGLPVRVLGDLGGSPDYDLAVGVTREAGGGKAYFYFGDPDVGPFGAQSSTIHDSTLPTYFGLVMLSGAFNGLAGTVSLLGDSHPDVALAARNAASGPPVAYLVDGRDIPAGGDVISMAAVTYDRFPADWPQVSSRSTTVRDADGDGYADLAFGETATEPYDGRVLVLW